MKIEPNIIKYHDEEKIINILFNVINPFSCVSKKDMKECLFNDSLNENLICSMKAAYVLNYLTTQYHKALMNKKYILKEYTNNNILHLSKKYKISPINIFRIALIGRGLTNKEIIEKIETYMSDNNAINEYDETQFQLALKYDIYSLMNQKEIFKKALEFEKVIETLLRENNVQFKTQDELTKEQQKTGRVYATPDFLILSNFKINENVVKWIDAKNFYGANTPFIKNKIKKQTIKYIQLYGPGCIIFKHGFSNKLNFDNIVITNL